MSWTCQNILEKSVDLLSLICSYLSLFYYIWFFISFKWNSMAERTFFTWTVWWQICRSCCLGRGNRALCFLGERWRKLHWTIVARPCLVWLAQLMGPCLGWHGKTTSFWITEPVLRCSIIIYKNRGPAMWGSLELRNYGFMQHTHKILTM